MRHNLFDAFKFSKKKDKKLRQPGIEPGSTAWKAAMLTIIPLTPCYTSDLKLSKSLLFAQSLGSQMYFSFLFFKTLSEIYYLMLSILGYRK